MLGDRGADGLGRALAEVRQPAAAPVGEQPGALRELQKAWVAPERRRRRRCEELCRRAAVRVLDPDLFRLRRSRPYAPGIDFVRQRIGGVLISEQVEGKEAAKREIRIDVVAEGVRTGLAQRWGRP